MIEISICDFNRALRHDATKDVFFSHLTHKRGRPTQRSVRRGYQNDGRLGRGSSAGLHHRARRRRRHHHRSRGMTRRCAKWVTTGCLGCIHLKAVDCVELHQLTSVGHHWLRDCGNLTALDCTGLEQLTTVGDKWLFDCCRLASVDYLTLARLTRVGHGWMSGCSALRSVDGSGLTQLTNVGSGWLFNCDHLTTLNCSGLANSGCVNAASRRSIAPVLHD